MDASGSAPGISARRRLVDAIRRLATGNRGLGESIGLAVLLVVTGVGYGWNLSSRAFGNPFYAAAVQAGTKNWTAFAFGSLDSGNLITVDKPPASLWPMELSGRIFGFTSWSMLMPQVVMAVVAVHTLYATVRRVAGPAAGLLAGALLALTPVAYSMFRFNDPDALLMLLLALAAYCIVRALESARTRWLVLAGGLVGLAFLTKELMAFLPLPGMALGYLWAAPTSLGRRVGQLLAGGAAILLGAGWWVLAVALTPAAHRPYLDGSADNSELSRALVSNGLSRLLQGPTATVRSLVTAGEPPGLTRLFDVRVSGYISWLIPAALLLFAAGLWLTRRAPRTDLTRGVLLMFGTWLVIGGLVLSFMGGVFHEYYSLILAPPIVGLVTVGGAFAWRTRGWTERVLLAATAVATAAWCTVPLSRDPLIPGRLTAVVLAVGLVLAVAPLVSRGQRWWQAGLVAGCLVLGVGGPTALATLADALRYTSLERHVATQASPKGRPIIAGGRVSAPPRGHHGSMPGHVNRPDSRALSSLLEAAGTRWSAATLGSPTAADLELQTRTAVMALGGFAGITPVPTLAQFEDDVRSGLVRYYLVSRLVPVRGTVGAQIADWVEQHFHGRRIDGGLVYDLNPSKLVV
jgi:4-amino-4-deoxy-L-arabinose transferase-like glycosyltransferase